MNRDSRPDVKIREGDADAVDDDGDRRPIARDVDVSDFSDQDGVVGEESVEEGDGEVLEVGEGVAAVGDDVVAEGADVDGGVGGHVEGVEQLVSGGEESEV